MKLHLGADAWHSPRNPAKQAWLSLPGLFGFCVHFVFGRRAVEPSSRRAAKPSSAALAAPVQQSLEARMLQCRQRLLDANLEHDLPESLIAEAVDLVAVIAARVIGLTPTRAQLSAARGMLEKNLVQLAPGEGKTLAIAMAGVILAWRNRPCHVVTANEYLAERDALLMEPLYAFCGLTARSITSKDDARTTGALYQASVVYATANQLLADFLRDDLLIQGADSVASRLLWKFRQRKPTARPVMPGLCSAIIDEADSVLIDEATTPLIISHPQEDRSDFLSAIAVANRCMSLMQAGRDYERMADASQAIRFTLIGLVKIRELAQMLNPYWQREGRAHDLFKTLVTAREFFLRDRNYIVRDGEVVIIDDHTGRATPGRSWSNGIHQAVEAKEGLELTQPSKTVARMTFQTFFRHYHFLCGASGTLHGLDVEMWFTYGLKIQRVPSNTRSKLHIRQRRVFRTRAEKFAGLIDLVVALHRQHVPVLVGTRRIEDSEKVADALSLRGLACTTLNAKRHEFESQVIELAGRIDSITVATDMAGRGSDIQIEPHVEAMGGLHVLMYESHESARVDWQLYGRAGRQGAQGVAYPLLALDDELLKRFLPRPLKWIMHTGFERLGLNSVVTGCLWFAQRSAQRFAMQQRRQLNRVQGELRKRLSFVRDW
jgi:preprotein translocase subunit SecA